MKKSRLLFLLSIVGLSITACGGNNKETSSSTTSNEPSSPSSEPTSIPSKQAFHVDFTLNEINEPFDIHNEKQNGYLSDSYQNIDDYGKGSLENSKPNSLELSWSISNMDVELTGQFLNLFESDENDQTIDEFHYKLDKEVRSMQVTNLKLGASYEWSITAVSHDLIVLSEPSSFETVDGVARFINIDGLSNVRDCGGWTGLDGKKIKQGLLYRGEELNKQNNGRSGSGSTATTDPTKVDPDEDVERAKDKPYGQKITEKGIDTFVNELKIKTEIDVRGYETFDYETRVNDAPVECGGLHDGRGIILDINYVINPVHTNRDKIYYDSYGKAACKKFFSMLADEENYLPAYFHCAQGKDRTGFLAYLFEAFLGCSNEDMMRDYLLSNLSTTGSVSISKVTSNYNYVDYFDGKEVSTESGVKYQAEGDTTAERAYNYLLSCGLTNNQLETIRDTFLEK